MLTRNSHTEATMRRKPESGQALVLAALALVVLTGFAGLAIDMGTLRYQKRLQQNAADAAAIAGASNLASNSLGVTAGAQNASATNGFTDAGGGQTSSCTDPGATVGTVCVQVNNPPLSGPHTSNANYVEVLVAAVQPTYFMRIFGVNSETITARAVATNVSGGAGSGCLYALDTSANGVSISSSGATLNATGCGIVNNGNFGPNGGGYTITTDTFGVSGTCNGCGGGTVVCVRTPDICPTYRMPPAADPLANLAPPLVGAPTPFNIGNIIPGVYNGISLIGNGTFLFPAGNYILDGADFLCGGIQTIQGTGVTFFFTNNATFNCAGNVTLQLTAPTTGPYAGILFYQDPNDTRAASIGASNASFLNGALYFPKAGLTLFGNNNYDVAIIVADAFTLSGSTNVTFQGAAGLPAGVKLISNVALVE